MGRKRSKHKRRRDNSSSTDSSTSSSDRSMRPDGHKNRKHKKKKHRKSSQTRGKRSSTSRSRTHNSSRDRQSSNSLVRTPSLDKAAEVNICGSKSSATPDSKEQAISVISGGRSASITPKPSGSRDVVISGSSILHRKSSKTCVSDKKCSNSRSRSQISTDNRQSSNSLGKTTDLSKAGALHVQASRPSTTGPDNSDQVLRVISDGHTACSTPKPSGSRDVAVEESSKRHRKTSKTHVEDIKSSRSSSRTNTSTCNGQSSNNPVRTLNDKAAVIHTREARSSTTLSESREQVIPLTSGGHAAGSTSKPSESCDGVAVGSSGECMAQLTSGLTMENHSIPPLILPKLQVSGQQQSVEVKKTVMESPGFSGATSQSTSKETNVAGDEAWKSELQCSICSEQFIKATMLNCSHTFCEYCIRMWKRNKLQCPLCRTPITSENRVKILDSLVERISQTSEEKKQAREEVLRERQELEANQNRLHPPAAGTARTLTGGAANSDTDGGAMSPDLQLDYYDIYDTDNGYADSNNDDDDDDIEDDFAFYDGSGDHNDNGSIHYYGETDNDENDEIGSDVDNDNNDDHSDDANEDIFVNDSDDVNDYSENDDASGDNNVNSIDENDDVSVEGHEVSDDSNEVSDNSIEVSDNSIEVSDGSNVVSDGEVDIGGYDDENDGRSVTDNNDDDDGEVAYGNSDDNLNDCNSNNESNVDYDHIDENDCDYDHGGGSGDNDSHYDNVNDDYDDDNDNGYDGSNCNSDEPYNSDSS